MVYPPPYLRMLSADMGVFWMDQRRIHWPEMVRLAQRVALITLIVLLLALIAARALPNWKPESNHRPMGAMYVRAGSAGA